MIRRTAIIESIDGGTAVLLLDRTSSCSTCLKGRGCGMGLITDLFARQAVRIRVRATESMSRGDRLVLGLDNQKLEWMTFRLYLLPLMLLLTGMTVGHFSSILTGIDSDLSSLTGGVMALLFSFCSHRVMQSETDISEISLLETSGAQHNSS